MNPTTTKSFCAILCLSILLCVCYSVNADELLFESGQGFYTSGDSRVAFFRYLKDTAPLFGFDSYYDLAVATWSGENHNDAIVIARAERWNMTEKTYVDIGVGGAYLERTTHNLGTRLEFALRAALGLKAGAFDLALGYNHFSNGEEIFHWKTSTSNLGENFITLRLGYVF